MRNYLFIILSVCCLQTKVWAANYYEFQKISLSAPYTELVGDTAVPLLGTISNSGYEYYLDFLLGDTFSFFNKNFYIDNAGTKVLFSTSGHIGIPTDTSFLIFDGMFTYLDSIDVTSKISYKVEGAGNDKVIKIQWKNLKIRSGPAGNYVNFQMFLYKATGVVEIYYGPSSVNNQNGYTNATGPNIGMFYSNATFTSMFEKIWINGLPDSYTIDSSHTVVFNAMHGVPTNGTLYRFVPKAVAASVRERASAASSIVLFPNPAVKELTISRDGDFVQAVELQMYDLQGRVVLRDKIPAGSAGKALHTGMLPAGHYTIRIDVGGVVESYPVEIRH